MTWQADPAWLKRLRDRNVNERKAVRAEKRNYHGDKRPAALIKQQDDQSKLTKRAKETRAHKMAKAKQEHKPFRQYLRALETVVKEADAPYRGVIDIDLTDLVTATKADTLPWDLRFVLVQETHKVIGKVTKRRWGSPEGEIPWALPAGVMDSLLETRAALKTDEVNIPGR